MPAQFEPERRLQLGSSSAGTPQRSAQSASSPQTPISPAVAGSARPARACSRPAARSPSSHAISAQASRVTASRKPSTVPGHLGEHASARSRAAGLAETGECRRLERSARCRLDGGYPLRRMAERRRLAQPPAVEQALAAGLRHVVERRVEPALLEAARPPGVERVDRRVIAEHGRDDHPVDERPDLLVEVAAPPGPGQRALERAPAPSRSPLRPIVERDADVDGDRRLLGAGPLARPRYARGASAGRPPRRARRRAARSSRPARAPALRRRPPPSRAATRLVGRHGRHRPKRPTSQYARARCAQRPAPADGVAELRETSAASSSAAAAGPTSRPASQLAEPNAVSSTARSAGASAAAWASARA